MIKDTINLFEDSFLYQIENSTSLETLLKKEIGNELVSSVETAIFFDNEGFKMSDNEDLLPNIIKSVQLTEESIQLFNIFETNKVTVSLLQKKLKFNHLIFFGIPFAKIGMNIEAKYYRIYEINEARWLFVDRLIEISGDPGKKKLLWKALQKMFQISPKK